MKRVVIGFFGVGQDTSHKRDRWSKWRPTVGLCQHKEFPIDRLELLVQEEHEKSADYISSDIYSKSPKTEIVHNIVEIDDPWDFEDVYSCLYEFSKDYPFDTDNEEYFFHMTTGTHVAQICLFLLIESNHLPGKILQTSPDRYRKNAIGEYRVIDLDLSKYNQIASRFEEEKKDDISFLKSGIDTKNQSFNKLIEKIEKVSINSKSPILLTGPTGAGKSHLARRIFELKKNKGQIEGELVELNCATLRGDAAMSALFGHKKGAFTGALNDRIGALLRANKGILFLDEIGELGLDEQTMLLDAIENKKFIPLGCDNVAHSQFQLICGTNRDLKELISKKLFRDDLLARINLWTFELPALKDRPEDIEPNLKFELDQFSKTEGRQIRFNNDAWKHFLKFSKSNTALWNANFRDLNASITRMATLSESGRITTKNVSGEISTLNKYWETNLSNNDGFSLEELLSTSEIDKIDLFDQIQLKEVIKVCRNSRNMAEAGRTLYSVSRSKKSVSNDSDRLRKFLAKFKLNWKDICEA